jgi:phosphonate transport system permease protein
VSTGAARARVRPVWRPKPAIRNPLLRYGLVLGTIGYLYLAFATIDVNWDRVVLGMERAQILFAGFLRPDFVSRWQFIQSGILESISMTVVATVLGVALSIPFAFGAARNIAPLPIYLFCRAVIAVSRSLQEIVIAIIFVVMVGFGPLAGVLTLAFASIGFLGKLIAEDIEDIEPSQLEAIQATGGTWLQSMAFGVVPQIMPRFIGLSVYRLDINFRESAVIGIVGAGGIGGALNTSISRYEYGITAAIILVIVALVYAGEYASGVIRKRVQ